MDTKWKSRLLIIIWTFLFTFGISGIASLFAYGSNYTYKDYFHTPEFQSEMESFAGYLNMFELNDITLEEAKKAITVTEDEIEEHRYRYGSLPNQVENIKQQYEERIQGAIAAGDKDAEKAFTDERDAKIKDITKNFESDDYVRPKVVKEKEKKLEQYFKEREHFRNDFLRYKKTFTYYFQDAKTGEVYTNLNNDEEPIHENDMLFVTTYTITDDQFINYYYDNELREALLSKSTGSMEGKIGIPKSLPSTNWIMQASNNYKHQKILLLVYILASFIALLICFILRKQVRRLPEEMDKWKVFYNKLPIDLRIIFIFLTLCGAIISMFAVMDWLDISYGNPIEQAIYLIICLAIATFAFGLTFTQWKFILPELKDWSNLKNTWGKALSFKVFNRFKVIILNIAKSLQEAFLNKSLLTQGILLLGAVFVLGIVPSLFFFLRYGLFNIFYHPVFLLFYFVLLGVVGLPIALNLIKKIGYFNRIINTTNELAAGELGNDLPVTGKSVLATLAGNINVLKQGVKTSLNEQAKSERLKTELITNVSHDLRTPLTSIITYTELLKKEDVSNEEKAAYVEIIDRKSKRLKVLIDDLFEVSKMASGNIELVKEKVDIVQLLQQALGEYDDTIKESSLQFRVVNTEKPIYAIVDGQKLWRVFDNLIGNILKYSLEHSRVYITAEKNKNEAMITFKNVTKYELSENVDELFERFKRGDTSRHTDGSGLGLAIAKSIIDLHDGKMDIDIDGDLFKVSICLKLANER